MAKKENSGSIVNSSTDSADLGESIVVHIEQENRRIFEGIRATHHSVLLRRAAEQHRLGCDKYCLARPVCKVQQEELYGSRALVVATYQAVSASSLRPSGSSTPSTYSSSAIYPK